MQEENEVFALVEAVVEKYRPGKRPGKDLPDEVVRKKSWVNARTGELVTDPDRINQLEAILRKRG